MEKIIKIKNTTKSIRKKNVINNISLEINKGEIIGLLGPNGAGKTTLMKMLVGLISCDEGQIIISGLDFKENREKILKNMGVMIEGPRLYPNLTGRENLKYFSKIDNVSSDKVQEKINLAQLGISIDKKVSTYSLGMKQRLGIALAFLPEPKIVVLDEPTNGLDPQGSLEFYKIVRETAEKTNATIIISSHLLSEIEKNCDRVAIINQGKLVSINELHEENGIDLEELYLSIVNEKEG